MRGVEKSRFFFELFRNQKEELPLNSIVSSHVEILDSLIVFIYLPLRLSNGTTFLVLYLFSPLWMMS